MTWTPMTLREAVARNVARNRDGEALVFKGTRVTWGTLDAWSDRLARALLAYGVAHGDKVATFTPNTLEWTALFCALGKIGAVIVPVNFRYKAAELAYVLKQSDSIALIAATRPIAGALKKAGVVRWLDRITGGVFLGFGLKLALTRG